MLKTGYFSSNRRISLIHLQFQELLKEIFWNNFGDNTWIKKELPECTQTYLWNTTHFTCKNHSTETHVRTTHRSMNMYKIWTEHGNPTYPFKPASTKNFPFGHQNTWFVCFRSIVSAHNNKESSLNSNINTSSIVKSVPHTHTHTHSLILLTLLPAPLWLSS